MRWFKSWMCRKWIDGQKNYTYASWNVGWVVLGDIEASRICCGTLTGDSQRVIKNLAQRFYRTFTSTVVVAKIISIGIKAEINSNISAIWQLRGSHAESNGRHQKSSENWTHRIEWLVFAFPVQAKIRVQTALSLTMVIVSTTNPASCIMTHDSWPYGTILPISDSRISSVLKPRMFVQEKWPIGVHWVEKMVRFCNIYYTTRPSMKHPQHPTIGGMEWTSAKNAAMPN